MTRSYLFSAAALWLATSVAWSDVTAKAVYKSGTDTSTSTVYLSHDRQRYDFGGGIQLIRQADKQRIIEIDQEAKSWVAMPLSPQDSPGRKGGTVTVTTTVTDLGETKPVLGFSARHLKTTTVTAAGPGTCQPRQETVETDGWYVDIEYPEVPITDLQTNQCVDEVRYQTVGGPKPGYPVSFTSKTLRPNGEAVTISMEVTELSIAPIPAALLEPPADYTERKTVAALATARPKPAGVVRIGILPVADRTERQIPMASMDAKLAQLLTNNEMQGVVLASAADEENAHCDYVLQTNVSSISKSAVGQVTGHVLKIGGMLSRNASKPPAQDGTSATLDFRLIRTGQPEPVLASTAAGKNGSALNLSTALQLAQIASAVTPMGMMMRSYGGLGMFGSQMGMGGGFGGPGQGLAMLARGFEQATKTPASPELAAVSAALEGEAHAVAAKLKPAPIVKAADPQRPGDK
jgi:hypothetical protein